MLTCCRRRRRRRLQGDATPRTLVGVSEAQKKRSSEAPFGQTEGAIHKRSDVWFFRLFCPGFPKFFPSTIPPRPPLITTALAVAADLNLCISFYTAATTFGVLFYLYIGTFMPIIIIIIII